MDEELKAAIECWLRYKDSLAGVRFAAGLGHSVPLTSVRDFVGEINNASRRLMTALDCRDGRLLEALGEVALNAKKMLDEPGIAEKQGRLL